MSIAMRSVLPLCLLRCEQDFIPKPINVGLIKLISARPEILRHVLVVI